MKFPTSLSGRGLHPALGLLMVVLAVTPQAFPSTDDSKIDRTLMARLTDEPDARTEQQIVERLAQALGREVRAHFRVDRNILGGVVVRVGDRILDGSVRRRLMALKRRMLTGE